MCCLYFLGIFPWLGKGKGPVIHFLGQYAKRTLNGGINQPTFRYYCLLQGVKRPREITRLLFAIRNVVLF